ncbi:MAG: M48 family metalloprotease [Armatimonadota bacterium]
MRGSLLLLSLLLGWLALPAGANILENTSPQKEVELGRAVARYVEEYLPVSTDKRLQERVQRVGGVIVAGLQPKVYPYEFRVLALPEYNAFALPGGFIFVFEGLLAQTSSDDELAFVLAHEITHAAHRHWAQQTEKMKIFEVLGAASAVVTGTTLGSLVTALIGLKYTRDMENDADKTALEHLHKAGFDFAGADKAMQTIARLEQGHAIPIYLRSHPKGKDRLARIQAYSKELKARPPAPPASPTPPVEIDVAKLVGALPAVTPAPNPWFPLAPGSEYTYSVKSTGPGESSYTLQILGIIATPAGPVYTAQITLGKGKPVACQYLTTATEVWKRTQPTAATSKWQLEYLTDAPAPDKPSPYTLVGAEALDIPCGSFKDARKMRRQLADPPLTLDMWFAQGVGLLKRLSVESGVTETLVSYKVPVKKLP